MQLPGMRVAVIARPPTFDGVLIDFDDSAALAIPGVIAVRALRMGVVVIAETFWAAETRSCCAQARTGRPGANGSRDSALARTRIDR
jgi:isoquinoline 1-oxidoreductase beta subunit